MEEGDQELKPKSPPGGDDSISMLRKQLYAKDEPVELQQRRRQLTTPLPKARPQAAAPRPNLVDMVSARSRQRRKVLRIAALVLAFLIVLVSAATATIWYRRTKQVVPDQIGLTITAPTDVIAGQITTYTVTYRNDSHVRWDNIELVIDLPGGMRVTTVEPAMEQTGKHQYTGRIQELAAGASGEFKISGQLIGEQGAALLTRAKIAFTPENFPSGRFDKSEAATTAIASVPLEISVEAANGAADGERVPIVIHVRNSGSEALTGTKLSLEAASGINLAVEDEAFSSGYSVVDGSWDLPTLAPLEEITRTAVVFLDGTSGERRILTIRGVIQEGDEKYALRSIDQVFTISASQFALAQTFNDSAEDIVVKAGDVIKAKLVYKNTGTTALSNAVVTVQFEGTSLDASKIKLSSGAYDPTTKTITWRAASVPGLATIAPQQGGEIPYEFAILPTDQFPADDTAKNQNLIVTATIDSPNLPTSGGTQRTISDRRVLPVATTLMLAADAFYDDGRLGIKSTGPLPPKVGQTTTYTMRLRLGTTLNDIGDVKVTAVLPDGVSYTNKIYKTTGDVEFNDRTNEVTWNIPFVEGLAGRAKPGPEFHMQVGITPGENVRGDTVLLLQSAQAHATDLFTDQAVEVQVSEQALPDTEDAAAGKGKVE